MSMNSIKYFDVLNKIYFSRDKFLYGFHDAGNESRFLNNLFSGFDGFPTNINFAALSAFCQKAIFPETIPSLFVEILVNQLNTNY